MLNALLCWWVRFVLGLRYRIVIRGADRVRARGQRGILFLPNHPALIDPIIVVSSLYLPFRPRALADRDQIDRFFIRWLARRGGVRPLPDVRTHGPAARDEVAATVEACAADLRTGQNVVMYPAGHLYRSRYEDLRGNSGVESLLAKVPNLRVVLVRTRGLWGSRFGLARGAVPDVGHIIRWGLLTLLENFIFFGPRRVLTLELYEPTDLPRTADRQTLNAYMQKFYNADAPPALHVPYTGRDHGGVRVLPEPDWRRAAGDLWSVPETTRKLVLEHLRELTGEENLEPEQDLAGDLGLDSLARTELLVWLTREFGATEDDVDALQTVGDVLLAARGQAVVVRPIAMRRPPVAWLAVHAHTRIQVPSGDTITAAFLAHARANPGRLVLADQIRGAVTYRDILTALCVLTPRIRRLPGQYVGIMLPASVGAGIVYFAALFAGKIPVMINWTTGARNLQHILAMLGVEHVLTAGALLTRLAGQGVDLSAAQDRLLPLEQLVGKLSWSAKLTAAARARWGLGALAGAAVQPTAVVLVTSGSESLPKAVPLTHANILANLRDVLAAVELRDDDVLMAFLPPFHSFGLTVSTILPLLTGMRTVYHANPTEGWVITRLIQAFRATLLIGTPTFLSNILRAAPNNELATLRLAVTGAEKCPPQTYAALARRCPQAKVLEGYGITECSPIVAVGRVEDARPGTIGRVLRSIEHVVVDAEAWQPVPDETPGLLLVRGPSIFGGYLGDAPSPFVEYAGKPWYRTGDLVSESAAGILTFRGRLQRFIKVGGEMISLPAIEAALESHLTTTGDEGPTLAVVPTPGDEQSELVLYCTRSADRAQVNRWLRAAGLSPLHNISRVIRVDALPLLGTGKTDYRALRAQLETPR